MPQELGSAVRALARNLVHIADILDDLKTGIPALDAAVGVDRKKKRKSRDPNMPKNPKSAYILFSMAKREEVKKETGGDVREVMTELARRWQALSDKQKQPYIAEATKEKKRHEKAMEEYRLKKSLEEAANGDVSNDAVDNEEEEEGESSSEDQSTSSSESSAEEAPAKVVRKKPLVKLASKPSTKPTSKPATKPATKSEPKTATKPEIKHAAKKKKHSSSTHNDQPNKKARKNKQ
ncbi:hypothetical protein O0I10_002869 [Lichtheimia ornata]|uniref:HMG box domain-containing protein n=1 Tax=Lichtheimia ornata TaxID=688661 RepID=A0AAD7VCA5_9FUNG|nr:uncharacterized protein O0I10_002869 [Lichtheimia ornata]KAJ8661601.1 hypothetical protein O0I10_002869 [Lichtheimia ornata]